MTKSEATAFVDKLEQQFARDYPAKARDPLICGLMDMPVEAGRKAYGQLVAEERYQPPPALVMKITGEWAAEIREQQANKERRENVQPVNFLTTPKDSEHAKRACQLVRATVAGIGREKLLEGMDHMHTAYPTAGWKECANKLAALYGKKDENKKKWDAIRLEERKQRIAEFQQGAA